MKRYILYIFSFLLMLCCFASCEVEDLKTTFGEKGNNTLTLRLNTGGMESRATEDGEDTNNENLIQTLDCFFYTSSTGNAIRYKRITGLQYVGTESHEITITFEDEDMKALFGNDYLTNGNGKTCLVYIIANRPESVTITGTEKIAVLKGKTLEGSFSGQQSNFVMDSGAPDGDGNYVYDTITLTVQGNTASLSGHVPLYRAAAKIGLFVHVPESIEIGENENKTTWEPVAGSMTVEFHKGVRKGNIDNTFSPYQIQDADFFNTEARSFDVTNSTLTDSEGTVYNQTTNVPFYTYPTSTAEGQGTYFTLYLSWQNQTGGQDTDDEEDDTYQYKNCSYQIPINKLEALTRNNYYRLLLNVGVLGTESGVVTLEPSYIILDWNEEEIKTNIEENVYLVVQEHDVIINNKNTYSVEFASSHDIEVQILSITQPNYSDEIAGTSVFCNYNKGEGKVRIERGTEGVVIIDDEEQNNIDVSLYRDCSVNVNVNSIVLNHTIVNRGEETVAKEYDIAPYTITVYVKMVYGTDSNGIDLFYDDVITFTQYPSMYAEAKYNGDDANRGNVWVYNNNDNGNLDANWLAVRGANDGASSGGTNTNHNMYVIHVSSLSSNDSFVLGDSRNLETPINGSTLSIGNQDSQRRTLQNYYATRTDEEIIIAPIFRMASSHGKLAGSGLEYELAKRRCAAYQEDGYPAGRWRIPTYAELKYIAMLSSDEKIPHLYSNEKKYWTATGICTYANNADDITNNKDYKDNDIAYVRCVYDEWYWGSDQLDDKTKFTWGDE